MNDGSNDGPDDLAILDRLEAIMIRLARIEAAIVRVERRLAADAGALIVERKIADV